MAQMVLTCYAIPKPAMGGWGHTRVLELSPMASLYERAIHLNGENLKGLEVLRRNGRIKIHYLNLV